MIAMIVKPDGRVHTKDIENSLEALNTEVGGYIEFLPLFRAGEAVHAYINEEGKLLDLPPNFKAYDIAVTFGGHNPYDAIVGPMVILGATPDGDECDLPHDAQIAITNHLANYNEPGE